ncbi:hypothetical protein GQ457_16G019780 [Hibiscus cannabinus]
MVLIEAQRKKRDWALRNLKKTKSFSVTKKIEEASITSSDLRGRQKLLREARNILDFGRQVGFVVEGNLDEAVQDCARLLENQF